MFQIWKPASRNLAFYLIISLVLMTWLFLTQATQTVQAWWPIQSVDTMKMSRDLSRELLNDPNASNSIDQQVTAIAETGATHVAIGTPYDEKFIPVLQLWVTSARRHGLKVWFRGNWSGWEQWFEYPAISRQEHIKLTQEFILKHRDLFADGDIFSACPECENGGPGDPRKTGDVIAYRTFLIQEHDLMAENFAKIHKDVNISINSMNGDVARLIMDKATTQKLGGIVAIDHYVETPEKLQYDIQQLAYSSGGKIFLGEFGAPIPDIHGSMSETQQANWLKEALDRLASEPSVMGVNYWTHMHSSTALWTESGSPKKAVSVITDRFKTWQLKGQIVDEQNLPLPNAIITTQGEDFSPDPQGLFSLNTHDASLTFTVSADEYQSQTLTFNNTVKSQIKIKMSPTVAHWWRKFLEWLPFF